MDRLKEPLLYKEKDLCLIPPSGTLAFFLTSIFHSLSIYDSDRVLFLKLLTPICIPVIDGVPSITISVLHNSHLSLCRVIRILSTPRLPITMGIEAFVTMGSATREKKK